ncbi:hypothetical protein ASG40_07905 [Methylobacterium sp. Leaf399]|uniref:peptidoglycan-binding domain-containing protein n=1 Tax=Methylobacterium sp. Leaf399 TaxID=1736364 RepID=UPI00070146A7|nr:peptidoglycan-binding domain-containing protein [Methylobacterium sp. Leaf399]KQT11912.1 hypothetical protein ASG40_07905 [Methylobacterium sp. Leaf399]
MREPSVRRDQREIAIPSDARADARPPARRRAASGGPARGAFGKGFAVVVAAARLCRRRPAEVLGVIAALVAAGAVSLNALGSQTGRHPAPILANLSPKVAPAAPPRKASAEKPPEKTAQPATTETAAKPEAPRQTGRDGIGDILKASEPSRPGDTTASVTPKAAASGGDAVIKAQRALVKLGYGPLRADGVMGAGTRAAITKFERDSKLPVKGEPAGRTLRELASRAGLPPG